MPRCGAMVDDIAIERSPSARGKDLDFAMGTLRTEGSRWKVDMGAIEAALQSQLAFAGARPEMFGLGCGNWKGSAIGCQIGFSTIRFSERRLGTGASTSLRRLTNKPTGFRGYFFDSSKEKSALNFSMKGT